MRTMFFMSTTHLDRRDLLRLAAEADSDPRSIENELAAHRGERPHVRGVAGERVRRVLRQHGHIPPRAAQASTGSGT